MMKKDVFYTLLASVMLAATAGLTTACTSNDDNPTPSGPSESVIKEKIVGKWKAVTQDGTERVTDKLYVMTFNADGTMTYSSSTFFQNLNKYTWRNKAPFTYSISGNVLTREGQEDGELRKAFYEVTDINDQEMQMVFTSYILDGQTFSRDMKIGYERITADYSEDIIGMWEVTEMTGEETYNDDNARLAFLADGTYRYYRKDDTGEWQLVSTRDVEEYFVDGDWLATRWQETGGEMNYEWWDIDEIKDGQMKWSALREREDGTRFTTTFTWRKVDDIVFLIDEEHFPDAEFRNRLCENDYAKDGLVTVEELANVDIIQCANTEGREKVKSLKGIELFPELTTIWAPGNDIAELDVTKNAKLQSIDVEDSKITSIDLTQNPNLSYLNLNGNRLTAIDLSNNHLLRELYVGNNKLTAIDVRNMKNLFSFSCYNNQLSELILPDSPKLYFLRIQGNQIKGTAMDALIASLPDKESKLYVIDSANSSEQNVITTAQVAAAKAKGWLAVDVATSQAYPGSDYEN